MLLHAPAVFDFRDRRDIYFPFLGTSGDVPITPLYEYFPVGFKTLQRFLGERGHEVRILNLSSLLLKFPHLKIEKIFDAFRVKAVGIDLHWMVHVQGALKVAEQLRAIRPDIPIMFGGISSTYYANELVEYPYIDMVMRGYDTHEPMDRLLTALKMNRSLDGIPNLLWKTSGGEVRDNDFSHKPDSFACGIDWSVGPSQPKERNTFPILEFLSTQNAGCAYNCNWCGGSREAFRRIFGRRLAMARKPVDEIAYEFSTLKKVKDSNQYHFYSIGSYNESKSGLEFFVDQVGDTNLKSVSYEQFHLTPDETLRKMAKANKRTSITLSPESHDLRISKLSGRGVYTNAEMEDWIDRALDTGIQQIDVWYFIGMPEQDERSVFETVDYAQHLLEKFKGRRVNPMLCPMIPFLDPASTFFVDPEPHGYRVFHRSVEQHRHTMEQPSLLDRINYETKWLSRKQLVDVGFRAVRSLMQAKAGIGALPRQWVVDYVEKIDDALMFIDVVHEAASIAEPATRARELDRLGDEILARNTSIFFSGVANQAFPVNREIGGRWFDELGWSEDVLEATLCATP